MKLYSHFRSLDLKERNFDIVLNFIIYGNKYLMIICLTY